MAGIVLVFAAEAGAASKTPQALPQRPGAELPVDGLIVKFAASQVLLPDAMPDMAHRLGAETGLALTRERALATGAQLLRLAQPMNELALEHALAALRRSPMVDYADADQRRFPTRDPNDPRYSAQWSLHLYPGRANLPAAWDVVTGLPGIVVAVLDTGLLPHVDIDSNLRDTSGRVVVGYDFITYSYTANDGNGRDADPSDPGDWNLAGQCGTGSAASNSSWHGTHVAGIIGALTNNGIGVAGVTWGSRIQPLRVLGRCGGYDSDIIDAMLWAAGKTVAGVPTNTTPARVLNLSLGGQGACSSAYQDAVNAVVAAKAVVVVAAGNEAGNAANSSPGNCSGVITVAATDSDGQRATYSNTGSTVEISAPGGDMPSDPGILSTLDGGTRSPLYDNAYVAQMGTSMAAPHVAGVAALVLSKNAALTPAQVLNILQSSARSFPLYSGSPYNCNTSICGAGLLDAAAAVSATPLAIDTTPDAFTFPDVTGSALDTLIISAPVTVRGINAATAITLSGDASAAYSKNGGSFVSGSGTVVNGDVIRLRLRSAATASTARSVTVNIGGVTDLWHVTTGSGVTDTVPNVFSFTDVSAVATDTVVVSAPVTISGINAAASLTLSGASSRAWSKNGAAWNSSNGYVVNGDVVRLQLKSAVSANTGTSVSISIGGVADTWSVTTGSSDTTPAAFNFTDVTGVASNTTVISSAITVTGINTATAISIASGSAQYSKNGAAYTATAGTVVAGDSVRLRMTSAASGSTLRSAALKIGTVQDVWNVTTMSNCPAGYRETTRSLNAGYSDDSERYSALASGTHSLRLKGPASADFDLYLLKSTGSTTYQQVARSEGTTSTEAIDYAGTPGDYLVRVKSYSGSGVYTLCSKTP